MTNLTSRRLANLPVCGLLLALFCLQGCTSPTGGGLISRRGDSIHELHLFVLPVALKSAEPGAHGGFAVRVFASSRAHAKGVPIRGGTLEILAYDGTPQLAASQTVKPDQVWAYPAVKLPSLAVSGSLGTGYELTLPWQGPRPASSRLSLVARHTGASGAVLLTSPVVIPNSLK
ncbi:MAG: hypothetical protein HZA92_00585 [Verrucomicrobia bacterium]|nr:hypothetical protein [Verrucomicrobiota bacterium]